MFSVTYQKCKCPTASGAISAWRGSRAGGEAEMVLLTVLLVCHRKTWVLQQTELLRSLYSPTFPGLWMRQRYRKPAPSSQARKPTKGSSSLEGQIMKNLRHQAPSLVLIRAKEAEGRSLLDIFHTCYKAISIAFQHGYHGQHHISLMCHFTFSTSQFPSEDWRLILSNRAC